MAVLTFDATASFVNTANQSAYTTAAFTPAANDELLALCEGTAISGQTASVTDSLGGTWTQINKFIDGLNGKQLYLFARDQLSNGSALTITVTFTGAPSGGAMQVYRVANGSSQRTGAGAIRQSAGQSNQTAASTPAPAFGSAALTLNPVFGAVALGTNPATMTPPATFTEDVDTGYATPVFGIETASVQSGFTGTTVTWGSAPATSYCDLIAEVDLSLLVSPTAIPSAEAFGTPVLTQLVQPTAIGTAETWGIPSVTQLVSPVAIGSGEAWGLPVLTQLVQPVSISSAEAWGAALVTQLLAPVAIGSAEAWGAPTVTTLVAQAKGSLTVADSPAYAMSITDVLNPGLSAADVAAGTSAGSDTPAGGQTLTDSNPYKLEVQDA